MRAQFAAALALIALPLAAAPAASPFDGNYAGPRTVQRGEPPTCTAEGQVTWTVTDGRLALKYGNVPVTAEVIADGTFRATVQYQVQRSFANVTLQGRIVGNTLEADLEGHACKLHYALKKR